MADPAYVQVQFPETDKTYTFLDASNKLGIGDQFEYAPERNDFRMVTVVSTDKGFDGNIKSVNPITVKTNQAAL